MMRTTLLAAGLLALAVPAAAQQAPAEGKAAAGLPAAAAPTTATDPAALRALIGRDVEDAAGEAVGKVEDVVMMDGRRTFLVVSVGGFLGLGERLVTVPYEQVTMTSDAILVGLTEDQLKAQPAYDPKAQIGTSLKGSGKQ